MADINKINQAIKEYFDNSANPRKVPARDLMDLFIEKGIFRSNHKNGLPIRKVLRDLDEKNQLNLIPYVLPERKSQNTYWYFIDCK